MDRHWVLANTKQLFAPRWNHKPHIAGLGDGFTVFYQHNFCCSSVSTWFPFFFFLIRSKVPFLCLAIWKPRMDILHSLASLRHKKEKKKKSNKQAIIYASASWQRKDFKATDRRSGAGKKKQKQEQHVPCHLLKTSNVLRTIQEIFFSLFISNDCHKPRLLPFSAIKSAIGSSTGVFRFHPRNVKNCSTSFVNKSLEIHQHLSTDIIYYNDYNNLTS